MEKSKLEFLNNSGSVERKKIEVKEEKKSVVRASKRGGEIKLVCDVVSHVATPNLAKCHLCNGET